MGGSTLRVDPICLAGGLNSFAYVDGPLVTVGPLGLVTIKGNGCRGKSIGN
jgi:hypothetical protein